MVDGGQADVLVAAAVARDVVGVEHLVVVGGVRSARVDEAGRRAVGVRIAKGAVAVLLEDASDQDRHGIVSDVVEEGVAGEDGGREDRRVRRGARDHDVVRRVRNTIVAEADDDLGEAGLRMRDEVAVGVGAQQRHVGDVGVRQFNAEHRLGLRLDVGPGGEAPCTLEQVAGGDGLAVRAGRVFAQEDLVRGMRGVGLVLVDPRRCRVDGVAVTVAGGARHHHEVGVAARDVERVIRRERDVDRAAAALRDQVEAVVEELAEQGEHRVVGRGVADVGRDVRDQDGVAVHLDAELAEQVRQGGLGRRNGLGRTLGVRQGGLGRRHRRGRGGHVGLGFRDCPRRMPGHPHGHRTSAVWAAVRAVCASERSAFASVSAWLAKS